METNYLFKEKTMEYLIVKLLYLYDFFSFFHSIRK